MRKNSSSRWLCCCLFVIASGLFSVSPAAADLKGGPGGKPAPKAEPAPIEDMPAHIEKHLDTPTEVQYLDTQIGDVGSDLSLRSRIHFGFDDDALASDGKSRESVVNWTQKDATLRSILNGIARQLGVVWTVSDEGIVFTTKAGEASRATTNVYSVADLADGDGNVDYDELTEMLTQSVDPESWRASGGSVGSIARLSAKKSLVITQTYTNHRKISALLKQLAEK